jgi:hypothetical protein
LVPVQTILPEPKSKEVVFGFLKWYTKPGNCSGLYSTPGKIRTIEFNILVEGRGRDHVLDVDESS